MTAKTATLQSREEVDAGTYAAYVAAGKNRRDTARQLGISANAVRDRVARHEARMEAGITDPEPQETPAAGESDAPAGSPEIETEAEAGPSEDGDAQGAEETIPGEDAGSPAGEQHRHCTECGFDFKKPQLRPNCKVPGACSKRRAVRDTAAASA